ncbi:MAG: hypothetical protein QMD65_02880 [Patescibacteria group bacterium]|nr:hypothetical protein [Patescibacteria group bacterium]
MEIIIRSLIMFSFGIVAAIVASFTATSVSPVASIGCGLASLGFFLSSAGHNIADAIRESKN